MQKILFLICLSFMAAHATSQSVWPGDINNNGVVNAVDLLYWGSAFGAEGPARAEVSSDWEAQPIVTLWSQDFPDGLNYAYADCNGDGVVDEEDFDSAIDDNFGEENPPVSFDQYANGATGNAPKLRLTPSSTLVEEGAMVDISLRIDTDAMSLDSFYGIALQISYSTGLLEGDDGLDFDLQEGSWLEADESYVQELFVDDDGQGTAQLAITRTNQTSLAAEPGTIGNFQIIVEDIIVGLEVDTFIIRIDSVLVIDQNLGAIPVVPDTAQIIIARDTSKVITSSNALSTEGYDFLRVYPNPSSDVLWVHSTHAIRMLRLLGADGRIWLEERTESALLTQELIINDLPPGVYFLQVWINDKITSRRIVIGSP